MSNHTPEPWRVGRPGAVVSDTPVPGMGGSDAVEYYGGHLIGESIIEANARRIVACVNFCAGVSTENLETNEPLLWLAEQYNTGKAQRDELLETLEAAVKQMEDDLLFIDSECGSGRGSSARGWDVSKQYLKMSDVFEGCVTLSNSHVTAYYSDSNSEMNWGAMMAGYAAHAINSHDELVRQRDELLAALKSAVDCGMVPSSSASEGGAARHDRQVIVADQIRAAIANVESGHSPDSGKMVTDGWEVSDGSKI